MGKKELIQKVAKTAGTRVDSKTIGALLDGLFVAMGRAIRDEQRFAWPGFGTFTVRERSAREGRNPQTGEVMVLAASRTVAFRPAPSLKRELCTQL